jgi:hypothetical protein
MYYVDYSIQYRTTPPKSCLWANDSPIVLLGWASLGHYRYSKPHRSRKKAVSQVLLEIVTAAQVKVRGSVGKVDKNRIGWNGRAKFS